MMLRPSYNDLIKVVNSGVEPGDEPLIQSRYSIVIATAKRARQLIAGEESAVPADAENRFQSLSTSCTNPKLRLSTTIILLKMRSNTNEEGRLALFKCKEMAFVDWR